MVILSLVLFGCSSSTEINKVNVSTTELESAVVIHGDFPYYGTIKELIDASDFVVIGIVEDVLPAIRIHENPDLDYAWANFTPSKVIVKEVLYGDITEGECIKVQQRGGVYTGISENNKTETITEIVEEQEYLEKGAEYLFFISGSSNIKLGLEYPYYPIPLVGYCKIVDGRLITNKNNNLLANGLSIDETVTMIKDNMNAPAETEQTK